MGHSIYLADDEKSIRELLHSFLASDGYTVRSFDRLAHIEGDEAAISEGLAKLAQEKTPVLAEVIHTGDTPLTGLEKLCRDVTEKSCVKILRVSDRGYVRAVLSGQDTAKSIADLTPEEIFELLDRKSVV